MGRVPIYATSAVRLGRHEWRMVVRVNEYARPGAERVTEYQWRQVGGTYWKPEDLWPRYDHADGEFGGLPTSLRRRVWAPNVGAIRAALAGEAVR